MLENFSRSSFLTSDRDNFLDSHSSTVEHQGMFFLHHFVHYEPHGEGHLTKHLGTIRLETVFMSRFSLFIETTINMNFVSQEKIRGWTYQKT